MRKVKQAAALKYDVGKDNAPRVTASGRGYIAERIIKLARENDVPIFVDDRACGILCNLPLDSEIPEALYQVIAEIYAFILQVSSESNLK